MKVERTSEMSDAPVAVTTEASRKFLEAIFKDSTMETTATPSVSQADAVDCVDIALVGMDYCNTLTSIVSAIARLSTDETIKGLAIHAKSQASELHNELDIFREQSEANHLAQRGVK